MEVFNGNIMENHRKIIYQWLFIKLLECSLLVQKIPSQMQGFARMVFVRSCLCICRICICRFRQDKCYTIAHQHSALQEIGPTVFFQVLAQDKYTDPIFLCIQKLQNILQEYLQYKYIMTLKPLFLDFSLENLQLFEPD